MALPSRPSASARPTVYYVAPATTDAVNRHFGATGMFGAASAKVLGVIDALQMAGGRAAVVSPWLPDPDFRLGKVESIESEGRNFIRISVPAGALRRRLGAAVNLALWALRVSRTDHVLFYNFFPEYAPAAAILRLRGVAATLDIEDGPSASPTSVRDRIDAIALRTMRWLMREPSLVVSHKLAERLGLQDYFVCYGVAREAEARPDLLRSSPVKVLYSGTIEPRTGLTSFCEAVEALAAEDNAKRIEFHVAGKYRTADFSLSSRALSLVRFHSDLTRTAYEALVRDMDVGLSLKEMSVGGVGDTTFPSKVIEIAAMGQLLVATPVSDVPTIFDENAALLLPDGSGAALAEALQQIILSPHAFADRAAAGRRRVIDRFGPQPVGAALRQFFSA